MRLRDRVLILAGVAVLAVPAAEAGEPVRFGPLAGATLTHLDWTPDPGLDLESCPSGWAGGFVGFGISDHLSIEARLAWTRKAFRASAVEQGVEVRYDARADYWTIPLLLRGEWGRGGVRPFLLAGVELGIRSGARADISVAGATTEDPDFDDNLAGSDFALDLGAGVAVPAGRVDVLIEALYAHGLRNISDDPGAPEDRIRTRGFRFGAGLRF